jgi:hypothetical protein
VFVKRAALSTTARPAFFWNPARAESFNLQSEVPAECLRALKLNALVFRNF